MNRLTKKNDRLQPSRFGPARKGRLKPCLFCKAEFYCPPCQDAGGSLPEKKYCSNKCANTDRYHNGKEVDRFWEKVDRSAGPEACWPWTGAITTHRYGCVQWHGRVLGAHKVAYLLGHGPVPDGLQIRHSCDNPPCCNPAHLSVGTRKDNGADKVARGRTPKTMRKFLTAEQVLEIRAARGTLSSGQIASKYGITQSYAFGIWGRKAWKHI
jgi:hypothetical protein